MPEKRPEPHAPPNWLLRRRDQGVVAVFVLIGLLATAGWCVATGGWQPRLIELDEAEPLSVRFEVDINTATWPELAQLPEIGEGLARRIVESREKEGPFLTHAQLRRVRGIGPKRLERIRPYLRPMPEPR